jgi:hypothetical protein
MVRDDTFSDEDVHDDTTVEMVIPLPWQKKRTKAPDIVKDPAAVEGEWEDEWLTERVEGTGEE